MYAWICQKRYSGICVNGPMIHREELRLLPNNCTFHLSDSWLQRFFEKKTTHSTKCYCMWPLIARWCRPNNAQLFSFTCQSKFMVDGFNRDSLINMDQASIYTDPEARTTYSEISSKRILATTAGQEKTRVSIAFSAIAGGTKLAQTSYSHTQKTST